MDLKKRQIGSKSLLKCLGYAKILNNRKLHFVNVFDIRGKS